LYAVPADERKVGHESACPKLSDPRGAPRRARREYFGIVRAAPYCSSASIAKNARSHHAQPDVKRSVPNPFLNDLP
jgi:hypothetical protein